MMFTTIRSSNSILNDGYRQVSAGPH